MTTNNLAYSKIMRDHKYSLRITIPSEIRDILHLTPGTIMSFTVKGKMILIEKVEVNQ